MVFFFIFYFNIRESILSLCRLIVINNLSGELKQSCCYGNKNQGFNRLSITIKIIEWRYIMLIKS
jgi:hypothetical protein